ncbi:hypothetical protein EMIT0158MI4_10122 [Burkholderia ambifaria]
MGESAVRAKSVSGRVSDMIGRGLGAGANEGEENPAFYHWRGSIPAEPVRPALLRAIGVHPAAGRRASGLAAGAWAGSAGPLSHRRRPPAPPPAPPSTPPSTPPPATAATPPPHARPPVECRLLPDRRPPRPPAWN